MFNKEELTKRIEEIRKERNIAGMSVAITDGEKIIYNEGFGCESVERPDVKTHPDVLYRIASMTKSVTAAMIMCLVDEGKLDLDAPVKKYIPELSFARKETSETVTLRHLLTHTSGMQNDYSADGGRDADRIEELFLKTLPTIELLSLPEERKFLYSNLDFTLAALAASRVTGKHYYDLMQEYVFDPLEMDRSTFDLHVATTYPLSLPHKADEDGNLRVIHYHVFNNIYQPGGGLFTNTKDLCKFVRMIMRGGVADNGKRVLSEKSVAEMCAKQVVKTDEEGAFYGFGVMARPYKDRFIIGHNGHKPPYVSSWYIDKETGLGTVVCINTTAKDLRTEIPYMIFDMME